MNNLLNNIIATSYGRRFGKTTAICKAALEIGATVICANEQQAKSLRNAYKVKTATIHQNLRGTIGPYLYDHFAMEQTIFELDNQFTNELKNKNSIINKLEVEIAKLNTLILCKNVVIGELDLEISKLKKRKKRKNARK